MEPILISACLLGAACRYDGGSNPVLSVEALMGRCQLVPVCPEQLGGLPTPREPAERTEGGVVTKTGADVERAISARRGAGASSGAHLRLQKGGSERGAAPAAARAKFTTAASPARAFRATA